MQENHTPIARMRMEARSRKSLLRRTACGSPLFPHGSGRQHCPATEPPISRGSLLSNWTGRVAFLLLVRGWAPSYINLHLSLPTLFRNVKYGAKMALFFDVSWTNLFINISSSE
jgi:hypothetical protein